MSRLNKLPAILNSRIFAKLFQLAAVSNLTKEEFMKYEKDLMASWDEYVLTKVLPARAYEEGVEKGMERGMERGMEKGRKEGIEEATAARNYLFVSNLLSMGNFPIPEIAKMASVTEAFVRKVKKQLQ